MRNGILVAYASNAGSTVDVAEAVAAELAASGLTVEVRPIAEVTAADLARYGAVVVGAPMILGWHRAAIGFLRRHRAALAGVPVALFATALTATRTDEPAPAGVAVTVDPQLAHAPRTPGRLSFKERYSRVNNYLRPMLAAAGPLRPVRVALFAGKLDIGRLKFLQMLFVMLIIGAQPGDRRNWPAIRAWARDLGELLTTK
jgi:menaquinone-dependent protoporphyrinogen IX oxidase